MSAFNEALAACLRESGWPDARVAGDGIAIPSMTAAQADDLRVAREACGAEMGSAPNDVPLTQDRAREIYAHQLQTVMCLQNQGYAFTTSPPSEEVFVASLLALAERNGLVEEAPWSPYEDLPEGLSQDEWDEVNERCPQTAWE